MDFTNFNALVNKMLDANEQDQAQRKNRVLFRKANKELEKEVRRLMKVSRGQDKKKVE